MTLRIVDHLLDRLNSPIWQSCLVAGIGFTLLLLRRYRTGGLLVLVAATWLYLCATPAFVGLMRQNLESQYPYSPATTYPVTDAIVVFGGDGIPDPKSDWQADPDKISRNRLGFAYQLYQAGRAPIIVLSANKGGAIKMARILEIRGIAATSLRIESQADTTYENALYSARILKQEKLDHVLLVTSPHHMPRALAALRKQEIHTIPAPTMKPVEHAMDSSSWFPRRAALQRSAVYLHEYLGLFAYVLVGRA
ncbi:hypothetical protein ASD55_03920 [Rhodanobacter sp. Root561]|nr:hypothetical protein ASD55_03920 [Rhodanobacter sp. Root561]